MSQLYADVRRGAVSLVSKVRASRPEGLQFETQMRQWKFPAKWCHWCHQGPKQDLLITSLPARLWSLYSGC